MNTTPTTPKPAATLSEPTRLLFHIAAQSDTLAEIFGIELGRDLGHGNQAIKILPISRPWLCAHPRRSDEYSFDPDKFSVKLQACSTGTAHMILWILNVWNPSYARSQGWNFDLFTALNSLDGQNRAAIAGWLQNPLFP